MIIKRITKCVRVQEIKYWNDYKNNENKVLKFCQSFKMNWEKSLQKNNSKRSKKLLRSLSAYVSVFNYFDLKHLWQEMTVIRTWSSKIGPVMLLLPFGRHLCRWTVITKSTVELLVIISNEVSPLYKALTPWPNLTKLYVLFDIISSSLVNIYIFKMCWPRAWLKRHLLASTHLVQ